MYLKSYTFFLFLPDEFDHKIYEEMSLNLWIRYF